MDQELRCVSSLLYAEKTEQDKFFAQKPPTKIFSLREREVSWLYRQYEIHGQFPTPKLFRSKFKLEMPKVRDTIGATLQVVMDDHSYRQLKDLTEKTGQLINDNADMHKVLEFFKRGALNLDSFSAEYDDIDWGKSKGSLERYQSYLRQQKMGKTVNIDSPWVTLNKLIDFLSPGEFVCLYGRTSMGKTQLAMEWVYHIVSTLKVRTLFISKEMPTEQVETRFEVRHLKLDPKKVRRGELSPKDQVRWLKFRRTVHDLPLIISGKETFEGTGFEEILAKIEQHKPLLVVIDGAYLLKVEGGNRLSSTERLMYISQTCKKVAKSTKTIVMGVIQQNRQGESKKGTKGGLETVYGSDAWAQDSDFLLSISGKRGEEKREVSIEKGRDTGIGSFMINFKHQPHIDLSELNSAAAPAKGDDTVAFDNTLKLGKAIK